jgi:hypothetical protein
METKLIEVRDRATTMPVLAILLQPADMRERWLLERAGYGPDKYVLFIPLAEAAYDPFSLGSSRTTLNAHLHLRDHWESIPNGAVLDVEFILGETPAPKASEQRGLWAEDGTGWSGEG